MFVSIIHVIRPRLTDVSSKSTQDIDKDADFIITAISTAVGKPFRRLIHRLFMINVPLQCFSSRKFDVSCRLRGASYLESEKLKKAAVIVSCVTSTS